MNEREIWDEFRWEEFMQERDRMVDGYMELFYRHRNRTDSATIIAREIGWEWILNPPNEDLQSPFFGDGEELEEGDEWKAASVDQPFDDLLSDPVCRISRQFARRAYDFVENLPDVIREVSCVVDFLSNAIICSAKIAGGTGMGNDLDDLGGNIACCKRGLAAANLSAAALREMRKKGIVSGQVYFQLIEEAVEVRDAIAVHILDLRALFRRSLKGSV
jgi:hypothetical protein